MFQSPYEDAVFNQKNKAYGAYQLRQRYARNVNIALGCSIVFFFGLYAGPLLVKKWMESRQGGDKLAVEHKKVVSYAQLSAPPPIEARKPPEPAKDKPKPKARKKFVKPTVKPDEEVPDEEFIPTQEELSQVDPGLQDIEGDIGVEYEEPAEVAPPPEPEPPPPPPPPPPPKEEEVFSYVEQMPEFPGGQKALFQFLGKELKYPEAARENGIQGSVVLSFVIEKDGSITNVQVIREIGGGCTEEALRVVQNMPKWNPGRQNDFPVRARFTLPIRFKLQE